MTIDEKELTLRNCLVDYIKKGYDIDYKDTGTPKISIYYMLGYLERAYGKALMQIIEEEIEMILEERKKNNA